MVGIVGGREVLKGGGEKEISLVEFWGWMFFGFVGMEFFWILEFFEDIFIRVSFIVINRDIDCIIWIMKGNRYIRGR